METQLVASALAALTGSPSPPSAERPSVRRSTPSLPPNFRLLAETEQRRLLGELRAYRLGLEYDAKEACGRRLRMSYENGERWDNCRMPKLHRSMLNRLDPWPNPDAVDTAWAAVRRGGLLALIGQRGPGKTQLACVMMQGVLDHLERTALYYRADDLFDHLRGLFSLPALEAEQARRKLWRTGLLVIDELQDRRDTDYEDHELRRIVDKRYSAMLPTILVANLTPQGFAERVGPSVVSRMQEVGQVLVCDWPSFRVRANA